MNEENIEYLYKYRPLYTEKNGSFEINENTLSLLTKGELFFSSPNEFNDPFDCHIPTATHLLSIKQLDNVLQDRRYNGNLVEILENQFANNKFKLLDYINKIIKKEKNTNFNHEINLSALSIFKICCFSEVYNEIRMWSHYASSHKGICIGIKSLDTNNFKLIFDTLFRPTEVQVKTVEYDDNDYYLNEIKQKKLTNQEIIKYLYHKSTHWEYEKERRIVILNKNLNLKTLNLRQEYISEIIFGLRTPSYIIKSTLEKIIESKFLSIDKVVFYKMRYVPGEYNIEKNIIDPLEYLRNNFLRKL